MIKFEVIKGTVEFRITPAKYISIEDTLDLYEGSQTAATFDTLEEAKVYLEAHSGDINVFKASGMTRLNAELLWIEEIEDDDGNEEVIDQHAFAEMPDEFRAFGDVYRLEDGLWSSGWTYARCDEEEAEDE